MSDLIHTEPARDLRVYFDTAPPPDAIALLEATVWGQKGLVFRSRDLGDMLDGLCRPSFLRLVRGGETLAAAVRNRKTVEAAGKRYDAVHEALFAVRRDLAGQGLGSFLQRVSRDHYLGLLEAPGLLYGYVETGNEASLRLNLGLGNRDLGVIRSRMFSRMRPRASAAVDTLTDAEAPGMRKRLKALYHDHALASFDHSLDPPWYFVICEGCKIVAGVQAHVLHWELRKLPGLAGWLALRLLPRVPGLRHRFTPADLRFARIGSLYAAPGAEPRLDTILETILARWKLAFAAIFADMRGPPERRMLPRIDFGPFARTVGGALHVLAEFKGIPDAEVDALCRAPVVISPRDPL